MDTPRLPYPMKLIYVSGPITARTAWEVEQNVRRAEAASAELFRRGVTNICVHAQGRFMDGLLKHGEWLKHDLAIIDRCDGVYICAERFGHSLGTCTEVEYARAQRKRVFRADEIEALIAWATGATGATEATGMAGATTTTTAEAV